MKRKRKLIKKEQERVMEEKKTEDIFKMKWSEKELNKAEENDT